MTIEEFAKRFIDAEDKAWRTGHFEALAAIESPDIVIHMPPAPDFVGFEAHKQYIKMTRKMTDKMRQDWSYLTGDGDVCVLAFKEEFTTKTAIAAYKMPAGANVTIDYFFVLRREKDRLAEMWMQGKTTVNE